MSLSGEHMTQQYEVIFYKQDGKDFINDWINSLRDNRGKLAVMRSIARVLKTVILARTASVVKVFGKYYA